MHLIACRTFEGPPALHVHDSPVHYADVWRNEANGWVVYVGHKCQHPGIPYTSGDPAPRPFAILDATNPLHSGN